VNFAAPAVSDGLGCVTDAADAAVAGSISPGELLTLYGVQLADTTVIAPTDSGELPTELGGVRVLFDDVAAPLLYTSPGQINTIVPYEVAGRSATRMVIERGGAPGEPRLLLLVPRSPSAFLRDPRTPPCDGGARQEPSAPPVLLNEDGSLNSCDNSAALGSVVTVFLNGLGVTPSKPGTGTVIPPGASIPLDLSIEPQRMVVSAAAGHVAGVWQVRIRLIGLLPPVGDISLKIDGTPLRQYLLTVFVK
jgi:uncharacterized protein (TIGR03437 family)